MAPNESEDNEERVERLVAENVNQIVWLRLKRLTSVTLCRRLLQRRWNSLDKEVLARKAEGLAWAIRSALGYWETPAATLNAWVLTRYYAILQSSIAEEVASADPKANLETIQKQTEAGHGLAAIIDPDCPFPNSYKIACLSSGHFTSYCRSRGIDLKSHEFPKRPREWEKFLPEERIRTISLSDLIRRVPELQTFTNEYLGLDPLSFHVGYASRNFASQLEEAKGTWTPGSRTPMMRNPTQPGTTKTTYVAIYPDGLKFTKDYLEAQALPIKNIEVERDKFGPGTSHFVGQFSHPGDDYWWRYLRLYKSGYCGTSIIIPFWSTDDPFVLHFAILYALSIVVRYLPSLWHDIEDGELDHIRALIDHYLVVVDAVLPHIALERITGDQIAVHQPGSFAAPV